MARHFIAIILFFLLTATHAQQLEERGTLHGTITDRQTGEALPGAVIVVGGSAHGATANRYGFYSLTLPGRGVQKLTAHYLGYQLMEFSFHFNHDSLANLALTSTPTVLDSVVVHAQKSDGPWADRMNQTLTTSQIKNVTTLAGEPDAIKALQFLPGVATSHEGTASLSVRGGSPDQNLYLLDDAPIYNAGHALNFFSVFNTDAIQSITLYRSAIPLKYGGRLSSVVDVQTREGSRTKRGSSLTIGSIASRFTTEGPLSNQGRGSYIVSGRVGYPGLIMNAAYLIGSLFGDYTSNNSTNNNRVGFYDFNAKMNWKKNERNHFYFSAYSGFDRFFFFNLTNGYSLRWGNQVATIRWNRVQHEKLFSNTTATFSRYGYESKTLNDSRLYTWDASMQEVAVKQDYEFYPNDRNQLAFGWSQEFRDAQPGQVSPQLTGAVVVDYRLPKQRSLIPSAYVNHVFRVTDALKIGTGVRYSALHVLRPYTQYFFKPADDRPFDSLTAKSWIAHSFHRVDPRIFLTWYPARNHQLSVSYDRTNQYLHLLSNSALGLPTDTWLMANKDVEPQQADSFSLTYAYESPRWRIASSTYYKEMRHVVDFKDNANLFLNPYVTAQIRQGNGESYGAEFLFQKNTGHLQWLASYTWSKTMYQIPGVNNGGSFPARSDRRHNLRFNVSQVWSKRLETSLSFVYTSGTPVTLPAGHYQFGTTMPDVPAITSFYYPSRYSTHLPDYHRLDFSLRFKPMKNDHTRFKQFWSIDIYNVYGRKNPFGVFAKQSDYDFSVPDVSMIYLFRVMPTLSYHISF